MSADPRTRSPQARRADLAAIERLADYARRRVAAFTIVSERSAGSARRLQHTDAERVRPLAELLQTLPTLLAIGDRLTPRQAREIDGSVDDLMRLLMGTWKDPHGTLSDVELRLILRQVANLVARIEAIAADHLDHRFRAARAAAGLRERTSGSAQETAAAPCTRRLVHPGGPVAHSSQPPGHLVATATNQPHGPPLSAGRAMTTPRAGIREAIAA